MLGRKKSARSNGGIIRSNPSTPPVSSSSLHHLELESLVAPRSPHAIRTNSGTFLSNRRNNSSSNLQSCPDRGRQIATNVSKNVFRKHTRLSCWVACLLGLMTMFVLSSVFEGNYFVTQIDGSSTDKKQPDGLDGSLPNGSPSVDEQQPPITVMASDTRSPTVSPTVVPTQRTISVHEHKAMNYTSRSSFNTFTTWLDFDEQDPPKRNKHPAVGNSSNFVKQWCDIRGTSWLPKEKDSWQTRAPYFLLPGAAYSGTAYLAAALNQHPKILPARTKELQFFHDEPFKRYVTPKEEKTLVMQARARRFAGSSFNKGALQKDPSLIQFDATPGYLYFSSLIPRRILCVEPWVKLVLLLRNPVDRILEQYAHMKRKGMKQSLEEWIDHDIEIWNNVGLNSTKKKFTGSKDEDVAWYEYTEQSKNGPIGRSVYAIQLRHWFQALRASGRDPATEVLLIRTDDLAANPNFEYRRVLEFLNLDNFTHTVRMPREVSHQTRPVSEETRNRLEQFFFRHNRRLKALMRMYRITTSNGD